MNTHCRVQFSEANSYLLFVVFRYLKCYVNSNDIFNIIHVQLKIAMIKDVLLFVLQLG